MQIMPRTWVELSAVMGWAFIRLIRATTYWRVQRTCVKCATVLDRTARYRLQCRATILRGPSGDRSIVAR
jgi:hypothetical protein